MPTIGRIGEALGAHLCTSPEASVEGVLGNVNTQYSVSHFKAFSSDPRSNGSASINLVHRICVRTRPRIPSSLNSGALKSGADSTARAWSPKGQHGLTAFLAIRQNDQLLDIRNVQGTATLIVTSLLHCRLRTDSPKRFGLTLGYV
jgi:hypothetical protein